MKEKCIFGDVIIRELKPYKDYRGWLTEVFRRDEEEKGLFPVMGYVSLTKPKISRGPHEHRRQTDYFCFLGTSSFILYLWDNRKKSPFYKKKKVVTLRKGKVFKVIIPPGIVHGYKNVGSCDGLVFNFPNRLYRGEGKKNKVDEIRYEEKENTYFQIR